MAFFDKINSIAKNVGDKTGDAIELAKINARIASEPQRYERYLQTAGRGVLCSSH